MNDSLLMRMLNGIADRDKKIEPLPRPQTILVTKFRDSNSAHQLHHEKWTTKFGHARIENFRDIWVIHQRERVPLLLETRDHFLAVHARLDDFQRHAPPDRLHLLRHPDRPKAALANLLKQFV